MKKLTQHLIRFRQGIYRLRRQASRKLIKLHYIRRRLARRLPGFMRTYLFWTCSGIVVLALAVAGLVVWQQHAMYKFSPAKVALLAKPSVDTSKIEVTKNAFVYNRTNEEKPDKQLHKVAAGGLEDSSGKFPFTATLSRVAKDGIRFGDSQGNHSFSLVPLDDLHNGQLKDGRVIYPASSNEQQVYTFKRNGIKADILLAKASEKTQQFRYRLKLDNTLEARPLPDGGIGIYSANSYLFGNISTSDDKDQQLIDNARKNGKKDNLVFVLPTPYIIDGQGHKNYEDVSFSLKDGILTLEARNLKNKHYPLTIDPTVVVTSTADFQTGTDTGMVDYGTSGQINRATLLNSGDNDTFSAASNASFTTARRDHTSVAYNGFLYVIGGFDGTNYKSDVQYASINATTGVIGSFSPTTSFAGARSGHTSVAYNGYLYVIGGKDSAYYHDVQYAAIAANGTVGTWNTTSAFSGARANHTTVEYGGYLYLAGGYDGTSYKGDVQYAALKSDGTVGAWATSGNTFTTARAFHSSVAYNGFLYVIGGYDGTSFYSNIQYAAIKSDNTLGTWTTNSTSFTTARAGHAALTYHGLLYVVGGCSAGTPTTCSTYKADSQFAQINSNDGSIGSFLTSPTANNVGDARTGHAALIYNNFYYIIGGIHATSDTHCNASSSFYCSDVQQAAFLNTHVATGFTAESTATSNILGGRFGFAAAAYRGYLYISGGCTAGTPTACGTSTNYDNHLYYAPINPNGSLGTWVLEASTFTIRRVYHTMFIYKGYLYIMGGLTGLTTANCKNDGNNNLYCNDVQRSQIGDDARLGTFANTNQYFLYPRYGHSIAIYNGYVYLMGGVKAVATDANCRNTGTNGAECNDVQYAQIDNAGSFGAWTTVSTSNFFGTPRHWHASVASNGFLYVMGGFDGSAGKSDIQFAPLSASGGLTGAFSTSSTALPGSSVRWRLSAQAANNGLYIIGGTFNGTVNFTDVEYIGVRSNGTLVGTASGYTVVGNLTTNSRDSPAAAIADNGYLYVMGGYTQTSTTACKESGATASNLCDDVFYAHTQVPSNSPGTFGTASSSLSTLIAANNYTRFVAYNGYIYASFNGYVSYALICTVNNSGTAGCTGTPGTLGTWSTVTNGVHQMTVYHSFGFGMAAYNSILYIWAGYDNNAGADSGAVEYASISSVDGSLSAFQTNPTNNAPAREDIGYAQANGYLYEIGGCTGACSSGITTVSYAVICDGVINTNGCTSGVGNIGKVGSWASTNSISIGRGEFGAAIFYNGYLYIAGGFKETITSSSTCHSFDVPSDTECNDIQSALVCTANNSGVGGCIGTVGAVGTWNTVGHLAGNSGSDHNIAIYNNTMYAYEGDASYAQYAPILSDGSVGAFTSWTSSLPVGTGTIASIVANGYLYIGGLSANVYSAALETPLPAATYERVIDMGASSNPTNLAIITSNTTSATCAIAASYRTAGTDGVYGSSSATSTGSTGTTLNLAVTATSKRYLWVTATIDDTNCSGQSVSTGGGLLSPGQSAVTSMTLTYSNIAPNAPTLLAPSNGAQMVPVAPQFRMGATDESLDFLQYKFELYSGVSNCTGSPVIINESSSSAGWAGESTQNANASYNGGYPSIIQQAVYNYIGTNLSYNTLYSWRAYAIDPGGNAIAYSSASSCFSFTTIPAANDSKVQLKGGTKILGGTNLR